MKTYVGFDPSTSGTAWAHIACEGTSKRWLLGYGDLADDEAIRKFVAFVSPETTIAVETPTEMHAFGNEQSTRAIANDLIRTARVAGVIDGLASANGLAVVRLTAKRWRGAVLGSAHPSDADVKRAICILIPTWPERSNAHVRDAAGVALGASMLGSLMGREAFG